MGQLHAPSTLCIQYTTSAARNSILKLYSKTDLPKITTPAHLFRDAIVSCKRHNFLKKKIRAARLSKGQSARAARLSLGTTTNSRKFVRHYPDQRKPHPQWGFFFCVDSHAEPRGKGPPPKNKCYFSWGGPLLPGSLFGNHLKRKHSQAGGVSFDQLSLGTTSF